MRPKPQIDRGKQKKNKGDDESALAEGVLDAQRKQSRRFSRPVSRRKLNEIEIGVFLERKM